MLTDEFFWYSLVVITAVMVCVLAVFVIALMAQVDALRQAAVPGQGYSVNGSGLPPASGIPGIFGHDTKVDDLPEVLGTTLDGEPVRLRTNGAIDPILLIFASTTCDACPGAVVESFKFAERAREVEPRLRHLVLFRSRPGLSDRDRDEWREHIAAWAEQLPGAHDTAAMASEIDGLSTSVGVPGTPYACVVNRNGEITHGAVFNDGYNLERLSSAALNQDFRRQLAMA